MTISSPGAPDLERMKARGDLAGLVALLSSERGWETRVSILSAIAGMDLGLAGDAVQKRAIQLLIGIIRNSGEHRTVRWNAIRTLGTVALKIEQPILLNWVVEALSSAAKDQSGEIRRVAVESLASLAERGAWSEAIRRIPEILIPVLRDGDWNVRSQVERALVRIGSPALKPLLSALLFKDDQLRQRAVDVLDRLHWQPDHSRQAAIYWIIKNRWEMCVGIGADAVEPLVEVLRSGGIIDRRGAAKALAHIGKPAIPSLLALLEDEDDRVRRSAAEALEMTGWQPPADESGARFYAALQDWNRCLQLGQVAIGPIFTYLRDANEEIRASAIWVLGRIGVTMENSPLLEKLVDAISGMLADPSPDVRLAAVEALGRIADRFEQGMETAGEEKAVARVKRQPAFLQALQKPLLERLTDPDRNVRRASGRALAGLGWSPRRDSKGARYWIARERWERVREVGRQAIQPLLAVLQDDDPEVRLAAADTLEKIGWKPDQSEGAAAYWIVRGNWELAAQVGAPAIPPIITALHSHSSELRQAAIVALGKIGRQEKEEKTRSRILEMLIAAFQDETVRASVLQTIAGIGGVKALPFLLKGLADADPQVRFAAVEALDQIQWKPENAANQADAARYWIVRRCWERAAELGTAAFEPLAEAYLQAVQPAEHQAVAEALVILGDGRAVDLLLPDLFSEDGQTRRISIHALERLGWQPSEDEYGVLYWLEKRQWEEILRVGVRAVEPLLLRFQDADPELRAGAMRVIGEMAVWAAGLPKETPEEAQAYDLTRLALSAAVLPLITAFGDPVPAVRHAAAIALGKIGDSRALDALSTVALNQQEIHTVCEAAVYALGLLGNSRAVEPLSRAFTHPHWEVRRAAAEALGQLGDQRTVDLLSAVFSDPREHLQVRTSAARSLGMLGSGRSVSALLNALNDPSREIRQAAAKALTALTRSVSIDQKSVEQINAHQQKIQQLIQDENTLSSGE